MDFLMGITWLAIIFIGVIAYNALKRADRALNVSDGKDWDSEISRELLFENFVKWIKARAKETPWMYKFWDKKQPIYKDKK